uniref:RNA-directed DNA polymerase, eukaryota n=1 Tax=Tanacetum cinerariifolium TaxID=118510 RepID=A0A6L2NXM1_TANCI|nr:RNA-directed DNA polymerase, eukaryota [Tanacetum cinerariifolium]
MICNRFFNGGDDKESRITCVAWEKIWRFLSQDGSLWYHVICAIHGVRLEQHSRSSNSTWGAIIREAHLSASKGFDFLSHCKIRVGDGSNTRRRARDGAESNKWSEFCSMLDSVTLSSSPDRIFCDLNGEGEFRVKDIRSSIDDTFLPSSDSATRWVKTVPIKVNILA